MSNSKIRPQDNAANMINLNPGSPGTNRQYDQNQGNRGKQLNPNQASAPSIKQKPDTSKK